MDREKSKPRLLSRAATLDAGLAPQDDEVEQGVFTPEPPVHQFILSEFKEKYDQLKAAFEAKKKDADGLLYDKKKLEIELLNHNVEYYEKEIGRLRGELERYQLENEENKHRFFVAENSRKDLQATSKVRHQQLKQTLKQLQREKITVVQLKHQLTQTTRNYTNVIAQVQNNNHLLSQKYDQTASALLKAEAELKTLKGELQQMRSKYESLEKTLKEKEDQEAAFNEKAQLSEYRSKHRIEDLEEQIKEMSTKQSQKIKKLQAQVKQLESQRKSEQFLLAQKEEAASYAQQLRKKQEQAARLQQKLRELTFTLSERDQKVQSLEQQLKNVCSIELLNESQERYAQALSTHKATERALQSKLLSVQRELEMAKIQSPMGLMNQPIGMKADFQQLLRNQIEENTRLKQSLSSKIDEVFSLRASMEQQQVRQSLLQNQLDILRKKQRAQQKNSKIGYEIELQNLKNDVDSLRRKVEVTETKLAIKTKQVKDKDAFISSVIIGRSRQEDVPFVVAQLKRVFQADYVSKLAEANMKIEHLQGRV